MVDTVKQIQANIIFYEENGKDYTEIETDSVENAYKLARKLFKGFKIDRNDGFLTLTNNNSTKRIINIIYLF